METDDQPARLAPGLRTTPFRMSETLPPCKRCGSMRAVLCSLPALAICPMCEGFFDGPIDAD